MSKQKKNYDDNVNKKTDRIIQVILIIIIVLLLLHNCSLIEQRKNNGKVNIIDIICNNDKCQKNNIEIDCLKDDKNKKCIIPNFIGKNKKDVLEWLNSLSNTIDLEIKTVINNEYKDGTVIEQSTGGITVKDLINNKTKLVITIVNNGSLTDCLTDTNNNCILPDFTNKKKSDVDNWLNYIINNIKIKYVYVESNNKKGTILNQSIKPGTTITDILSKDETIIIYISNGNSIQSNNPHTNYKDKNQDINPIPTPPQEEEEEPVPILDNDFYVNDKEIIKWEDETNINIFKDSSNISKVHGKIAPESTGTYRFNINNGTEYNLKYSITFTENNEHNMNIKYKLKKGKTYLIDHYVSYNELNLNDISLDNNKYDIYYLEWKWVGDNDDNDTAIGRSAVNNEIKYSLKINVEAEGTDE